MSDLANGTVTFLFSDDELNRQLGLIHGTGPPHRPPYATTVSS
jgi:hypothetical protein